MRVLSIDGGGIRGLIPATILAEIERRTNRRIADLFDFVAGTSTGGFICLALTAPDANRSPAWTAHEVVNFYFEDGPRIFSRNRRQRLHAAGGLLHEKYAVEHLEDALVRYFGETHLSDVLLPALIPAYQTERRHPYMFKREKARQDPTRDFPLRDVVRAATAAPTYFEPARIELSENDYLSLVDGGVYVNNPAMCAFTEARKMQPESEVFMVSLGTGELTTPLRYEHVRDWGMAGWARPLLDVTIDGVNHAIDHQLMHLLPPAHYFRFQPRLDEGHSHLDDASPQNLRFLRLTAERVLIERRADIDAICAELLS